MFILRGNLWTIRGMRFLLIRTIFHQIYSNILDEMTKYGVITYKRIYGDWTSPQAGKWKKELMENSITPIQQFRNTVGKNATDSTLIIDAMDILYTKMWMDSVLYQVMEILQDWQAGCVNLAWKLLEWVRTKHQGHSGQHVQYLLIWNFTGSGGRRNYSC